MIPNSFKTKIKIPGIFFYMWPKKFTQTKWGTSLEKRFKQKKKVNNISLLFNRTKKRDVVSVFEVI